MLEEQKHSFDTVLSAHLRRLRLLESYFSAKILEYRDT